MGSINRTARTAGFVYLIMIPFALFGTMWSLSLNVPGDAAGTANNIIASELLYPLSIVSALIVQIGHLLLVLVLYKLLKSVNRHHAALMVIFMLVSIPISMLNELNRFAVLLLLSGTDYLTAFTEGQLQALVPLFLDLHLHGVKIAGIFWGLWLFPMGYLVFKSGYIPKALGVLLIIAGSCYLIDSITLFLLPDLVATIGQFTIVGAMGELMLPLWLIAKGVNIERWERRNLESA